MSDRDLPIEARLVRDLIDWLEQRGNVPMLLAARGAVVGEMPGIPIDSKQVVLNVSSRAVRGLSFGPAALSFSTGFGPIRTTLSIPYGAVLQVGSAEEGGFVGAIFRNEVDRESPPETTAGPPSEPKRRFRIVKEEGE